MLLGVGHGTTLFAHQHQVADLVQHPSGPLNPAMLLKLQFRLLLWEIIAPIDRAPDWVRENARPRRLHASFAQFGVRETRRYQATDGIYHSGIVLVAFYTGEQRLYGHRAYYQNLINVWKFYPASATRA